MAVDPSEAGRVLGAIGGSRSTPAKVAAARLNGRKGGRPRGKHYKPRKRRKIRYASEL